MGFGKRKPTFYRRKRRTTTANIRTTKQQQKFLTNQRYRNKAKIRVVPVSDSDDDHNENADPNRGDQCDGRSVEEFRTHNVALQKQRDKYKRLWKQENKRANGLKRDLDRYIEKYAALSVAEDEGDSDYEPDLSAASDTSNSKRSSGSYVPPLTIENMCSNSRIITEKTFEPEFVKSFRDYMRIRLYCLVLRNGRALDHLQRCMDIYDIVRGIKTKTLDLGGTSEASLSRLMQYKALQLFRMETVIVIYILWRPNESVFTLHHDEASFKSDAWMSVLLVFDAKEPTIDEAANPEVYTPKLCSGNVVRAIWHQKIPGKDAETTVETAICPAIDSLDDIALALYGSNWVPIRDRLKERLACMSDQNTTALLTNKLIGKEFGVQDLVELVCLMHNIDNTLISAEQRLLNERVHPEKRDNILVNNMNLNILDIANRLQNHLMIRQDTDKNKGEAFKVLFESSPNKSSFTPFQRVIGGRRQHLARNVEAVLSRRPEIAQFGATKFNGKYLVTNPRLLYEYGNSVVLLRESLVFVCLSRNFITPMIKTIGRDCQLMKNVLPKIREALQSLNLMATNSVHAVRSLLTMTELYSGMQPHILTNKMLSEAAKLAIIDSTEGFERMNGVDIADFLRRAKELFRTSSVVFKDRYFYNLFEQGPTQFGIVLEQFRGVCNVVRMDLQRRYDVQSRGRIPNSSFTTNDGCETLNATGKYHEKRSPNISEQAKAAFAIHDVNRSGIWYTFDYLAEYKPKAFQEALIGWNKFCGTYKQARSEKIEYKKKYDKKRRIKLTLKLKKTTNCVPAAKSVVAKSTAKPIISKELLSLRCQHPCWTWWTTERDKYLKEQSGMGVSVQKKGLREILRPFMHLKRTHTASFIKTAGLEKLQRSLHEYCVRSLAAQQQQHRRQQNVVQCPPLPMNRTSTLPDVAKQF